MFASQWEARPEWADVLERRAARGKEVPRAPDLPADLDWLMQAYLLADRGRRFGLSGAPRIPVSEMLAALDALGIENAVDRQHAVQVMIAVDRTQINRAEQEARLRGK